MAIKEFRKILSQKWIIYILLLLCFVNVFLDTRNIDSEIKKADKKQEQQIEKIQGYNKYIENISSNANVISGFSLFADNNNYQVKSSKKIVNAYEHVENVKPKSGNYAVIEKATEIGFSDIIVLIAMLQCVIIIMSIDRKHGMLILLKSCRQGRTGLALGKIGGLLMASVCVEIFTFLVHLLTLIAAFGCGDLTAPVQSIPDFYESALPINILTYLIIFVLLKIAVVFSYTLFIFLIAVLCDNSGIIYAITGVVIGVSAVASLNIMWDYRIAFIKILSPVTLINIKSITEKYYNLNLAGNPFNVMSVGILIIIGYIALFTTLSTMFYKRKNVLHIEIKKFKGKQKNRQKKPIGMLAMEYKKLLLTNKGILMLLVLCIIQGAILSNVNTTIDGDQKYYSNYMDDVEGPVSESKEEYIQKEKDYFKDVTKKYKRKQTQYLQGKITGSELSIAENQYITKMMPNVAFKKVLKRQKYLKKLNRDRGIQGWYVNDIGINYLIHPNRIYNEKIAWIFMMLIMSVMVVICMAYEEQTGMDRLSDTTMFGGRKLLNKKIIASVTVSLVIFAISNLPFLILVIRSYHFSGVMAPINSLMGYENWIQIPILIVLMGVYIVKLLIMFIATMVVILISCKLTGMVKKMAVSITILVVPLIIMTII